MAHDYTGVRMTKEPKKDQSQTSMQYTYYQSV